MLMCRQLVTARPSLLGSSSPRSQGRPRHGPVLADREDQSAGPCRVGVSLHAHIPGDIVSFPHQHRAEGAVLTTTSQC